MKIILAGLALFGSATAFATMSSMTPASKAERALLCDAVTAFTETNGMDLAEDGRYCMGAAVIGSELVSEGTRLVTGNLLFNAPERPSFQMTCKLAYIGEPALENIVGGLKTGLVCK